MYRIDGETGEASVVTGDLKQAERPVLLARRKAAVHRRVARRADRLIHVYEMEDGGTTHRTAGFFIDAGAGTTDGMRADIDGNLWCGWGMGSDGLDGVMVFSPDGQADRPDRPARALREPLFRRARSATGCSWRRRSRFMRST